MTTMIDAPAPAHLSERGFVQFEPRYDRNGTQYRITEASTGPRVWLFTDANSHKCDVLLDNSRHVPSLANALIHGRLLKRRGDLYGGSFKVKPVGDTVFLRLCDGLKHTEVSLALTPDAARDLGEAVLWLTHN